MEKEIFKQQIDNLYKDNYYRKKAVERDLYSKKDFMEIATLLFDNENIEAVSTIGDNPYNWQRTKASFLRNWYIILTDKRILVAGPTLILKQMESFSFKYSDVISAESGSWSHIYIKINSSFDTLNFYGFLANEQKDEILQIIQKHMFS